MNQTCLWFCDICEKSFNVKSKSKHFNFKAHKHKKIGVVVKEFKFNKPDINEIDFIIKNCVRDCYKKHLHTFKFN